MRSALLFRALARLTLLGCRAGVASLLLLAGCPDKSPPSAMDAAPPTQTASSSATAAAPPIQAAAGDGAARADAGRDAADMQRFDPKYKCPTGQTHFYLEGDFCRRKCFSSSDCAKSERCSAMEYPFLLDGKAGGSGHYCEGL